MAIYSRSTVIDVKPFDAQELDDLWHAIDSRLSDDDGEGETFQVVGLVHDTKWRGSAVLMSATDGANMNVGGASSPMSNSSSSRSQSSSGSPPPPTDKRKPRKFTPAQVDMRRKRNRDSMRRVRQRKMVEVDHLRRQMELLQEKLEELRLVREHTGASSSTGTSPPESSGSKDTQLVRPRSTGEVQELLEVIKALQYEQVCLHNAILSHQQVSASLVQIIDESKSLNFRNESLYTHMYQYDDEFQWVNAVLPLLPPLSKARVSDLVRESYLDLVGHIQAADSRLNKANMASGNSNGYTSNSVLGWSDKRTVSGRWADFAFAKDFPHEDMDALAAKTWQILTYTDQQNGFQSQGLHLKVLEKLNDDTLLMARSTFFPLENKYYSSIYVLLRVETAQGYVIGGRTICPLPEYESRLDDALGDNRSYSNMFYGLTFDRLPEVTSASSSPSPPAYAGRGCRVKYGGRVGNGSELMAQTWAMDVLLAVLRWENSCVKPLYRLST